jgi:hypothetical protein
MKRLAVFICDILLAFCRLFGLDDDGKSSQEYWDKKYEDFESKH